MESGEIISLPTARNMHPPNKLIIIGTNTGGPLALTQLLSHLPKDFAGAVVVVQQIRPGFTQVVADILKKSCKLPAYEAHDGEPLQRGTILVAPGNAILTIDEVGSSFFVRIEENCSNSPKHSGCTDKAMISAAKAFGRNSIGILLTGFGEDGRDGMAAIMEAGGTTISQDESTSIVHDLPASAILAGVVKEVLPLWSIPDRLVELASGGISNAAAA